MEQRKLLGLINLENQKIYELRANHKTQKFGFGVYIARQRIAPSHKRQDSKLHHQR